jgi:hypothetical protein
LPYTLGCTADKPYDLEKPFIFNTSTTVEDLEKRIKTDAYKRFCAPGQRISLTDHNMDERISNLPKALVWTVALVVICSFGP